MLMGQYILTCSTLYTYMKKGTIILKDCMKKVAIFEPFPCLLCDLCDVGRFLTNVEEHFSQWFS